MFQRFVIAVTLFLASTQTVYAQQTPLPPPAPVPSLSPSPAPGPSSPSPSPTLTPSGPIAVTPNAANLHPSQRTTLNVANANGVIVAAVDAPLVQLSVDQTQRTVTLISGTQTGRTVLHVTDNTGVRIDVPVRVALDAGSVPPQIALRVTGVIDPAWLTAQIQRTIARSVQLQSGVAAPADPPINAPALTPGSSAAIPVPVHIAGGDQYFDVDATTSVNIENVDVSPFVTPLLFYDDDPEHVSSTGLLYRGRVTADRPVNLYYYHENSNDPHRLVVVLTSATSAPVSVQLVDSSAGPNIDVMSVGHAVTRDYLLMKPRNEGIVVDVPVASPYVMRDFAMRRLDGVAGNVGIRIVGTGAVDVAVLSANPTDGPAEMTAMMNGPRLPGDGHNRTGVFDLTRFTQAATSLSYNAGADDASVTYGAQTPPSAYPNQTGHDYGEYGVLRSIDFALTNPSAQPTTVYLYERPMGGAVRSSFLVDGSLVQLGCARVSERYQIVPLALDPSSTRRVNLLTMTDGGSSYPLEVGVTAIPPLPATPPISAPNGCFPKAQQPTPAASPTAAP